MSRRATILAIVLILVVGTLGLYFLIGGKAPSVSQIIGGSPFGTAPSDSGVTTTGTDSSGSTSTTGTNGGTPTNGAPLAKFFKISDAPVAGAIGFTKNGSTYVRYVDRATGHVFEVNPTTLEKVEIINNTMPKVYEALWKSDASGFLARSVVDGSDTVANTSVSLIPPKSTSTQSLYTEQATLLRGSIDDIALTPAGSLVYVLSDARSVSTASFLGDKAHTLLSTPIIDWRIKPINETSALIYTKASANSPGYAYSLNLANGNLTKLLGPLDGLTALLSSDGKRLAYSHVSEGFTLFSVLNLGTKTATGIFPVTLAEKCVWSKKVSSAMYCGAPAQGVPAGNPDLWYQGLAHFADQVWRVNTESGAAEILLDPSKNFNVNIDVTEPMLSGNEDYLFIINKNDLSLWALKLVP